MTFRLEPTRSIPENVVQVATEQVSTARGHLAQPPDDDLHEGIHEARKCFKRLRGLLRLVRPALGKARYKRENVRFRDLGRALSAVRDAQALVETHDMLGEAFGRRVDWRRFQPLRHVLEARAASLAEDRNGLDGRVEEAVNVLDQAAVEIPAWPLEGASPDDLAKGLRRTYRRARKGYRRALARHDPAELHEWRKRAKYLRYHHQLLRDLGGKGTRSRHHGFRELSDLLGDHHDLEVLRTFIDRESSGLDPVAEAELRVLMRQLQDALYRESLELGAAWLDEKPGRARARARQLLARLP